MAKALHTGSLGRVQIFIFCMVAAAAQSAARGDTLVLDSGRQLQGRLVQQSTKEVLFEVQTQDGKVIGVQSFDPKNVVRVVVQAAPPQREIDPSKPTYMVVPIEGAIGMDVSAGLLRKMLTLARNTKTDVVVLEIDSPGGIVEDLFDMLKVLQEFRPMRIVAYVRRAHSCAAILAMSCKEIIVAPTATIGGAVVFTFTPQGTPSNISAKFESIVRAECKTFVEAAGHDSKLVEGMMQTDCQLTLVEKDGRKSVTDQPAGGKVIKKKGTILTLSASEAVEVGLAKGPADTLDEVRKLLGVEAWQEGLGDARGVAAAWKRKMAADVNRIKESIRQADAMLAQAAANHPLRFRYSTRLQLQQQADACLKFLNLADSNLEQARRTIEANSELGLSSTGLTQMRQRISQYRQEVLSLRNGRR
ncbi:MAG: ATP-dependent Clp protease proteolytic subunit [Planctomycetaceae bacterium]|nr:ATP-dependent Clp protease proteolytic subunit [Planctomycetaceae bacterium]